MKRAFLTLSATTLCVLGFTSPAWGAFGLSSFDVRFLNADGSITAQAGSHPYSMVTTFEAITEEPSPGKIFPTEAAKDLEIFQVPGFIGDQTAVPKCSTLDFLSLNGLLPKCPNSTAVGMIKVSLSNLGGSGFFIVPFYNLEPSPGSAAKLGFIVQEVPVTIDVKTSEAFPNNILASSRNISQVLEFLGGEVTIWGVPAASAHDNQRGTCFNGGSCPAGVPPRPFLTLPRSCTGPLATNWEIDSWQHPGAWIKGSVLTHDEEAKPQGMGGCDKLAFGPTTSALPTTTEAESASGLDFEISVNDEGLKNPEGLAQADISKVLLALPPGVSANPSAAEGLGVCTKAQYGAESLDTQGCPQSAKLGSVQAQTPILQEHPINGSLFLASQDDPSSTEAGAENPFDSLLALYLIFRDPELGIFIKTPVKVEPDPKTGQLITTSQEIPPFPISHLAVHMRSGPRAPLITPPSCGTYTSTATLTPSSGAPALVSTSSFKITSGPGGSPCPTGTPPFRPGFEAGSASNAAAAFSPFSLRLTRADGEQDLTRFSATLPPGVTAKLAGVAKCPDSSIEAAKLKTGRAELASPSCPASTQLGHVVAGAGVGTALTYASGSLYLAGPYGGDPLSVVAIVPAVAGPFDVGVIVTRVALTLNPETARPEVDGSASDPIPHILKGLPLKVRDIRVYTDRPNFTLNPTSCAPSATAAQIFGGGTDPFSSADDASVSSSSPYQAASCASLPFKPKLSLTLKGGTKRGDHPALKAVLTPRAGDANLARAVTLLPHSEFIDQNHINNPCTRVQFNAGACPPASVLGTATATSPLLEEPLTGPIYFRSNGGERELPDIVLDLHGLFHIIQIGFVDSKNARIRTTFASVPDAPIAKVVLNLKGGKRGLLVNSTDLCAQKRHAAITLLGQNGRRAESSPVIGTGCKKAGRVKGRRSSR